MKIALHCWFILGSVLPGPAFAQMEGTNKPQLISSETMYVHFDKDIYLPGETIWFKAYLYNVNEPSYSSTNFYVAIYDESGKLLEQKQYPVFEGSCNGDFIIPDTIESGRLQFRAFTKAMIRDDRANIYQKTLTIYHKGNNTPSTINKTISLEFFPEGGQIISELQNHVAFRATYNDGSPAMVKGRILQVQRSILIDTLDEFATNTLGLGKFVLEPLPYKNYIAIWRDENGIVQQTPLPSVKKFGVSFHAGLTGKNLEYTVARNITNDSLAELHLIAQMGNYRLYKADLNIPNEMELAKAKFPIDSLPPGLLQLTLCDRYWTVLQERLIFINRDRADAALSVTDSTSISAKAKCVIEIGLQDTSFSNLSVSVADINFYRRPGNSIRRQLLLNTQIEKLQPGTIGDTDLVILAHPWKRYSWKKAFDKNSFKPMLADNHISLSINYKQKERAFPKDDAVNLIIEDQLYSIPVQGEATVRKSDLVFFDSAKVFYQMNRNKGLAGFLTVSKDSGLSSASAIDPLPVENIYVEAAAIKNNEVLESFYTPPHKKITDVQTIKEVRVRSKLLGNPILNRLDELDKFYTTGSFSGTRGFQLNVIDDPMAAANNSILDYIRFRVPGLSVQNGHIGRLQKVESKNSRGEYIVKDTILQPAIFIDQISVESEELQNLSMWQVAYIKYIQGVVLGSGVRSVNGALYVYTKKGTEKGPLTKGLPFVYIKGYHSQKEFASPDYADKALLSEPDLRSTLYWNPNIMLDKINNKARIEFYNNDVSKKLLLTIEGVNAKGQLIHVEKIIE
jgi:hypothetical protein